MTRLPQIAGLMERLADEAHNLADELWQRLRAARVEAGIYPELNKREADA